MQYMSLGTGCARYQHTFDIFIAKNTIHTIKLTTWQNQLYQIFQLNI